MQHSRLFTYFNTRGCPGEKREDFGTVSKHIIEMKADADVEAIPAKVVRARPGASAASPAPRPAPAVPAPAMPASGSPGRAAAKDEGTGLGRALSMSTLTSTCLVAYGHKHVLQDSGPPQLLGLRAPA